MLLINFHIMVLVLVLISSGHFTEQEVRTEYLIRKPDQGLIYHGNRVFTGISVTRYSNGQIAEKITYRDGKKEGKRKKWFDTNTLSYEAEYKSNRLDGTVKTWWSNGYLRSQSHFKNGKPHGIQQQWYSDGSLFKELNMVNGKEQGLQRAWRQNGQLFVNYEAKNGRIFGLKRANLCYELNDQKVVTDD